METKERSPKKRGPKKKTTESNLVKGNMTGNLPDDHPYKEYEFENVVAVKGYTNPQTKIETPGITLDQWYHIYLIPDNGNKRHDAQRKGWVTKMDPISYRVFVGQGTKGIDLTYKYDEVTLLHDPTKN